MAINTIEAAKIFQTALDLQMMQGATSGWMEDNAGQTKYSGGNEVKIPKMSLSCLGKYDRDSGYIQRYHLFLRDQDPDTGQRQKVPARQDGR